MSPQHRSETVDPVQFVVRPDGTVRGDDRASGELVMALPYTGRLGRRIGEFVDAGDLRAMECFGGDRLTVGVTWTPAGEGTFRAVVTPLRPRTLPTYTVVGAVDTGTAVRHCLNRISGVGGVEWASVVTSDSRAIDATGEPGELRHLAEVGTRMIAILRSLEDEHVNGFVRLRFEQGAMVGASLGRHALMAFASAATDDDLIAVIDEIRAILADHDLAAVTSEFDPGSSVGPERTHDTEDAGPAVPRPALPVGARFHGATGQRDRTTRRSLFGR